MRKYLLVLMFLFLIPFVYATSDAIQCKSDFQYVVTVTAWNETVNGTTNITKFNVSVELPGSNDYALNNGDSGTLDNKTVNAEVNGNSNVDNAIISSIINSTCGTDRATLNSELKSCTDNNTYLTGLVLGMNTTISLLSLKSDTPGNQTVVASPSSSDWLSQHQGLILFLIVLAIVIVVIRQQKYKTPIDRLAGEPRLPNKPTKWEDEFRGKPE